MATQGYATYGSGSPVRDSLGSLVPGFEMEIYDSAIGGAQVTDLLTIDDQVIDIRPASLDATSAPTPDAIGRMVFQAPEGYGALWGQPPPDPDTGISPMRWLLLPDDLGTRINTAISLSQQAFAAVANIQDATDQMNAVSGRMDGLEVQQDQLAGAMASLDDLSQTYRIPGLWVAGAWAQRSATTATTVVMWTAPIPCSIATMDFIFEQWNKPAGGSGDWTFTIQKVTPDGTIYNIVAKATSDEGVTTLKRWSFGGAVWNTTNATMAVGDTLKLNMAITSGAPSGVLLPLVATWRYVPV